MSCPIDSTAALEVLAQASSRVIIDLLGRCVGLCLELLVAIHLLLHEDLTCRHLVEVTGQLLAMDGGLVGQGLGLHW